MTELVAPFVLEYAYKRSLGPVQSQFLTGLRAGRLQGGKAADGSVLMPPTEYDPATGEDVSELVAVGPEGTVTTWTWLPEPPAGSPLSEPFAWALIKLDGADTAMLHAVAGAEADMKTGMRVRPRWAEERSGSIRDILCFEAVGKEAYAAPAADDEAEPITRIKVPTRLEYRVTAGAVTADFLRGILRKELNGKRCPSCEKVYMPPRGSCPTCGVPTTTEVPLGTKGTVTTFSVIRFPFEGQMLEPPYACAHILLDGADVPLLHIVGDCDVDTVRMGLRVEAVWADDLQPTLASVRYFRPTGEPDADYESYRMHLDGAKY